MKGQFYSQRLLRSVFIAIAAILVFCSGWLAAPSSASAYPFWAQENYATPREATGRIVCANCHLGSMPTRVEAPQAVLPDSVFKLAVNVPYDLDIQQVLGDGSRGGLNVGAVVMLPEGFQIAPPDRIPEDLKEEVDSTFFLPYSEEQKNVVIVGPLPGEQYQEIVFPVLSPDPNSDKSIKFGKYQIHVGGNRGRGQVYPTGQSSNNVEFKSTVAGTVISVVNQVSGGYQVAVQGDAAEPTTFDIPPGPELLVSEGDVVESGTPLTTNPNVGGFGQVDTEIVLQSPNRIKGLVAFLAAVMITQIMLVLKKKQVERVQEAEMSF